MNYKKISTKRELEIAEDIGGKRHTGSGTKWHSKGDDSNETILVEDKFVVSNKYRISLDVIDKTTYQAKRQGKIPILRFGYHLKDQEFNCACIETLYCKTLPTAAQFCSNRGKSFTFSYEDLDEQYLWSTGPLTTIELYFEKTDRTFYIFQWNEFIEYQKDILVLE